MKNPVDILLFSWLKPPTDAGIDGFKRIRVDISAWATSRMDLDRWAV